MTINLPYKVRALIYIANAVGSPIMGYLLARGVIGDLEVQFWAAEMSATFALAGLNIVKK